MESPPAAPDARPRSGLDAVGGPDDPTLAWEEIPDDRRDVSAILNVFRMMGAWLILAFFGSLSLFLATIGVDGFWVLCHPMAWWGAAEMWWLGVSYDLEGAEKLPRSGPFIVVANHQSLLEVFVYGSMGRPFVYIMKKEFARIPFLGWFLKQIGQVFLDRADRASAIASLNQAVERLREGKHILIFPEGTRRPHGTLGPFKKGAFHLAIQSHVPVIPLAMLNSGSLLPAKSLSFRPGVVRMVVCDPIDTTGWREETLDDHLVQVRKALAVPLARYRESLGKKGL
ncbi:MAG: 1-acyl-sn-glycerol-3-phosphate acyltransferase [Candidatus Riflebacteria bacterium]|nr:1-acyl-sn-glycerol-3-phosphate acyltransferase [Candidatus Riflebacteria bacterium]